MHTTSLALVYAISCESSILAKVRLLVTPMESSVLDIAVLLNKVSRPFGVIYEYNTPSSVVAHLVLVLFFFFFLFFERERERERESR